VDSYIRHFRQHAEDERAYFARGDRQSAISRAALAEIEEGGRIKRHPHQYRIPRRQLEEARNRLLAEDLDHVSTFGQLHQVVAETIGAIGRIGELAVYDIATRIGAFLRLEPDLVYLHRGTRDGARALGLGRGRPSLTVDELPSAFRRLRPYEIEVCLCIEKRELEELALGDERHPARQR
jgi:hypothetical protein